MGDYNIRLFMEKVFTEREVREVRDIYIDFTGHDVSLGLWPFLSHDTLVAGLRNARMDALQNSQMGSDSTTVKAIEDFIRKLDEESYWVDVTQIGDTHRREYNTVTEQVRYVERLAIEETDYALFGNVRKAL